MLQSQPALFYKQDVEYLESNRFPNPQVGPLQLDTLNTI